jgi:hypothetical protein
LTLCVKEKRVTIWWGFELFHAGFALLDTGSRDGPENPPLSEPEASGNNLYGRMVATRWTVAVGLPLPASSMAGSLPTIPDVYMIGAIVTKTRISVFALTP